jgi:hypothetical protein
MSDDPDRLFRCTDCGLLFVRPAPPAECPCGCPSIDPLGYTALVDAALEESDVMDSDDDPFQSDADVPGGEEVTDCPSCGATHPVDDVIHYLGGAECPSCAE